MPPAQLQPSFSVIATVLAITALNAPSLSIALPDDASGANAPPPVGRSSRTSLFKRVSSKSAALSAEIDWAHSFEEAVLRGEATGRPILVFQNVRENANPENGV